MQLLLGSGGLYAAADMSLSSGSILYILGGVGTTPRMKGLYPPRMHRCPHTLYLERHLQCILAPYVNIYAITML